MGLLERVERALETLVEGRFMGHCPGQVHPLEIAHRLAREMSARCRRGVRRAYVPNVFRVHLNPDDAAIVQPMADAVRCEIGEFLAEQVRARDYAWLGPVEIVLVADDAVERGQMRIACEFRAEDEPTREMTGVAAAVGAPIADDSGGGASRSQTTDGSEGETSSGASPGDAPVATAAAGKAEAATALSLIRASLQGTGGFACGMNFTLRDDQERLGRSPECELHLPDPQVSRVHVLFQWVDDHYLMCDCGSRNGTRVNGQPVGTERVLVSGDVLELGASTLIFSGPQ